MVVAKMGIEIISKPNDQHFAHVLFRNKIYESLVKPIIIHNKWPMLEHLVCDDTESIDVHRADLPLILKELSELEVMMGGQSAFLESDVEAVRQARERMILFFENGGESLLIL
jgi:hypothetical protein